LSEPLVVFCTCPSRETALELARAAVEAQAAACVNVLPGLTSVYRWQEAIHEDAEVLLVAKTTRARYPELEAVLRARHPYELPEVIAVPVAMGSPAYLQWLADVTA
jgi:periplasmic divalent cation tolerance protein